MDFGKLKTFFRLSGNDPLGVVLFALLLVYFHYMIVEKNWMDYGLMAFCAIALLNNLVFSISAWRAVYLKKSA